MSQEEFQVPTGEIAPVEVAAPTTIQPESEVMPNVDGAPRTQEALRAAAADLGPVITSLANQIDANRPSALERLKATSVTDLKNRIPGPKANFGTGAASGQNPSFGKPQQ